MLIRISGACQCGMPDNSAAKYVELHQFPLSHFIMVSNDKTVCVIFGCYLASSV